MTISVLIATKNRPKDLSQCITSLLKSTFTNFEIIVIDQSHSILSEMVVRKFSNIQYTKYLSKGKSAALNIGLSQAKGDIVAFTDDDCIVSPSWLDAIAKYFEKYPHIDGVFGSTYPYLPTRRLGTVCPSTFTQKKEHVITTPTYHVSKIGFGNNMAIKKSTLLRIGGFREWIGPNTLGPASEDAEIELRILTHGGILGYNPTIRLYHNRWLLPDELRKQESKYTRGEAACYGYYYFLSYPFAKPILFRGFKRHTQTCTRALSTLIQYGFNRRTVGALYWAVIIYLAYIAGIGIGFYFSLIDPLRPNAA